MKDAIHLSQLSQQFDYQTINYKNERMGKNKKKSKNSRVEKSEASVETPKETTTTNTPAPLSK